MSTWNDAPCWRSECRNGCYYPDVCSERPRAGNVHDLLTTPATKDAPQLNTCLRCGAQTEGPLLPDMPCADDMDASK